MLPRLAWVLAGLTIALAILDAFVSAQSVSLVSETAIAIHGFPFIHGAVIGSGLLGGLIISRYERHPIGWLISLVGFLGSVSLVTEAFAFWAQEADGPGSETLASVSAWVSSLIGGQFIIAGLTMMFLLAPDGHLRTRRWRVAAWLTVLGASLCVLAILSLNPTEFSLVTQDDDVGLVRNIMLTFGFALVSGNLVAAVVCMLLRLRASSGEQREQLRLIALAAFLPAFGIVWLFVVQMLNGGQQTYLSSQPLFIGYFMLPILFAIAVLKHQLYELDVIINRTSVLVAGTAFAALGYTTIVVVVGEQLEGRTGGFWLSLLVTTVVALAFQPLRRSVVRAANRLAYGERAQPYEALADFSRQLAGSPSPESLLSAVAAAAGRAVSARGARAVLDVPGAESVSATSAGTEGAADLVVPVRAEERELGVIEVWLARGRAPRASDERLLRALADQTALAFRNTTLAGELAAHVDQLDRTNQALSGSRLRIIEAEDAARRTLETAIARDVLPFLVSLPDELRRAREAVATGAADTGIEQLVEETNLALEALRDLTRGVFPAQLERAGLAPALRTLIARDGGGATLSVDEHAARRFSPRVETAVYFCVVEASRRGLVSADLCVTDDELVLLLEGSWDGGLDLTSLTDRVEAVGGAIEEGTESLKLTIPVGADRPSALVAAAVPGL